MIEENQNEISFPSDKGETIMAENQKAKKWEAYCKENEITAFVREDLFDGSGTVLFRSAVQVDDYTVPFAVIVEDSVFTVIRVQMADSLISDENRAAVHEYMNLMNRSYKIFKYVAVDDGTVFLDSCIPSVADFFDAQLVRAILDTIVSHVTDEYKNLLRAGGLLPKTRAN